MKVKFKKLIEGALPPSQSIKGDAGYDLTAISRSYDDNGKYIEYGTGLAMEIPEGYVGLIFPRSSVSKTDLILANCVGIIDSGYRGEIKARFKHIISTQHKHSTHSSFTLTAESTGELIDYKIGERIAQLIILPYPEIEYEEVEELNDSERGSCGFGSTGNK
jgi:dUTP pyrophosphatase